MNSIVRLQVQGDPNADKRAPLPLRAVLTSFEETDAAGEDRVEVVAYTLDQVCQALQISRVTLWRLEKRGLLCSIPNLRHKRYSVAAVKRFAAQECRRVSRR